MKHPNVGPAERAAIIEEEQQEMEYEDEDEECYNYDDHICVSKQYAHVISETTADVLVENPNPNNARIVAHPGLQRSIVFMPSSKQNKKRNNNSKAVEKNNNCSTSSSSAITAVNPTNTDSAPQPQHRVQNDYYTEDEMLHQATKKVSAYWVYANSPVAKKYPQCEDKGMCLSMHQPWASLLVHGIKKHEGRNWSTAYRGRLWIHAASHEPLQHEIATVENFYRGRGVTRFPTYYPTSVLLGSVEVTDCLHSDDYRVKIPMKEQESDSEFVFICRSPTLLVLALPMEGKHKIFSLDKKTLTSAKTQCGLPL
jgi:hypothetical protein